MFRAIKRFIRRYFVKELQILRNIDYILYYLYYRILMPVDSKQILMLSESRQQLSGNLQYIDDKINKNEFNVIYSMKADIIGKRTQNEKRKLCKKMAKSKYILVDDFIPFIYPIPLRKATKLIQVWHAMGAFKKVGFSRMGKPGGPSPRSLSHRNYTDAIVSSEEVRKNYAEAFRMPIENIHAIGIPRTDIFFDENYKKKVKEQLYLKYPVLKDKKIILFAPTFRGNGIRTAHYDYSWISFKELQQKLGDKYFVILKWHPFIKGNPSEKLDESFYLDLSQEREINDLLFITDILVTDYSSVIFEASLLNKCTVFYTPDYKDYVSSRDFYYDFVEYTYGSVAQNQNELINCIKEERIDLDKLSEFKRKFCSSCDGKSSERFVNFFFKEV